MTLLNRYILSLFNRLFLLSTGAFVGIFLLIDFFQKVDDFIEHGVGIAVYCRYFLHTMPVAAVQIVPLAVLLACFGTIGGLSRSNELTAMRSSGVSIWRVILPLWGTALALTLFIFFLNEYLIPLNQRGLYYLKRVEVQGKPEVHFRSDHIWFRENNTIFHIGHSDPEQGVLEDISILEFDDQFRLTDRKDSPQAQYVEGAWLFENFTEYSFSPQTGIITDNRTLARQRLDLNRKPQDLVETLYKTNQMGFFELHRLIGKLQNEGYDARRYQVDMHSRLSQPFTCLAMAILGVPFALRKGRGVSLAIGMTFTVAVGIIFYFIQAAFMAFGYAAILPPLAAAWAPVFLFSLIGLWLLLWIRD
ncbi:MAG: LPS export ABC transporter permease LptG [Desulfuromonadaceae bacterium]